MIQIRLSCVCLLFLFAGESFAFNALGHKIAALIAWERLGPERQDEVVAVLRRHPRFDDDFAKTLPQGEEEKLAVFLHASTWPDIARSIPGKEREQYNMPTWHYVNFPHSLDGFTPQKTNLSVERSGVPSKEWNILQAIGYCQAVIAGADQSPQSKAVAYCWMMHLVCDAHQPMHSTALFCERFPEGDKGGNSIPLAKGGNLHALWDGFLGKSHRVSDVRKSLVELKEIKSDAWKIDAKSEPMAWIKESHEIAKSIAYSRTILEAVRRNGDLEPIKQDIAYYKTGGMVARERIVAAGLRLAVILGGREENVGDVVSKPAGETLIQRQNSSSPQLIVEKTYWLNTSSNVRHNSSCKQYGKTKRGRYCDPSDGKACGICGG